MNNINEERVTNIQKLIELKESASNIPELENICENYELKEIASWGIEDVSFFRQPITDFKQIKKLMEMYEPYADRIHDGKLENAPPKVIEAFEKVKKWLYEEIEKTR